MYTLLSYWKFRYLGGAYGISRTSFL